jgi:hypothetical protein
MEARGDTGLAAGVETETDFGGALTAFGAGAATLSSGAGTTDLTGSD